MSFLEFITYAGVFVFALTGAFKARTYKMDVLGAMVLAFVTAYGGGTLRDLFIGVKPVNWMNDDIALILVFAATAITFILKENINRSKRTIFFTDAIGLGFFTAWGIEVAKANGVNDAYSLVLGVMTATFGGLLADVISNVIPNLLRKGELYATACAIGGTIYLILRHLNVDYHLNLTTCIVIVVATRIYSKRKQLMLPEI